METPTAAEKYKIKYSNGIIKDTSDEFWDGRFPIRTDNYGALVNDTVYKSYSLDGSPFRLIDENKFLTEFQNEPIHRISSITLPGDFSALPNSVDTVINHHYYDDTVIILSSQWGYDHNDVSNFVRSADQISNDNCYSLFEMNVTNLNADPSYTGFNSANFDLLDSIYSARFEIWPYSFTHVIDNNPDPSTDLFRTTLYPVTNATEKTPVTCQGIGGPISVSRDTIFYPVYFTYTQINISNNTYTYNYFDVKNLISILQDNEYDLKGFLIWTKYTGQELANYNFKMQYAGFATAQYQTWQQLYSPRITIWGRFDYPDTLFIPKIYGGTIVYEYDEVIHSTTVYAIRNLSTDEKSKIQYLLDGFGNIKEKNIFTSDSDSNHYAYQFNYRNMPARNFDALDDTTMYSYDALQRIINTKNSDLSTTFNQYSYQNTLPNYFGGSYTGFVEKQYYTDEEQNHFEKYFDAIGNLLQELKYSKETPSDASTETLITNYKYDSLYRITKVQTPNSKIITYSYDGYGRQSKRVTADAGQLDYFYDKNNNLIYTQDENQRKVDQYKYTFQNYDGLNRITGVGEVTYQDQDNPNDGSQYVSSLPDNYLTINTYDTISNSIVDIFDGVNDYAANNYTKGQLAATAFRTKPGDIWSFKYYRYDERGRVIKMWNIIGGFDTLVTEYFYNSQDQIIKYNFVRHNDSKTYLNHYDYAGRLDKVEYFVGSPDDPNPELATLNKYEYNENSQVSQEKLGDVLKNQFEYNNRNWISSMENIDGLFTYINTYYKNGNVKTQDLSGDYQIYFDNTYNLPFKYDYDRSNRLTKSYLNQYNTYRLENTYDKDGNILTLSRYDGINTLKDNFTYTYYSGTNKLRRVYDTTSQYLYDLNGNVTFDTINSTRGIKYDHRNLMTQLSSNKGTRNYVMYFDYDETGNRYSKTVYLYTGFGIPADEPEKDYVSTSSDWILAYTEIYGRDISGRIIAIYRDEEIVEYPTYGLDNIGKIASDVPYNYMKDHLGSIRATVDINMNVISAQDYDAWGYILDGRSYESNLERFKFTGKERDIETKYDYFGARYYDSRVGNWGKCRSVNGKAF